MYKFQQVSYTFQRKKKKKNIFCIRHFMVLVYVIPIIMLQYTIQYREICYPLNISWHTAVCAVQTKPFTAASYSYVLYLYSPPLCFNPLNYNQDTQGYFICHSVPVSLCALFTPLQHSIRYSNATKQTASHTLACSKTV